MHERTAAVKRWGAFRAAAALDAGARGDVSCHDVDVSRPPPGQELPPATDQSDAVVLHLWQAIQLVLDVAFAACLHLRLAAPAILRGRLPQPEPGRIIDAPLAERLARATGFRNVIAHAYDNLDMQVVRAPATHGLADLRAFLAAMAALSARPG